MYAVILISQQYTGDWNEALAQNAAGLGAKAAQVAIDLGVGIEIDYEENTTPNLVGLQAFINAYRSIIPFDSTGSNHSARLTIDVAAGCRYLIDINRKASADWLGMNPSKPQVLDYANAMVTARPYGNAADAIGWWQEHIDGKPQYSPPVPPLAPAKFTGALYLTSRSGLPSCNDYPNSLQAELKSFVETVEPHPSIIDAGWTPGMLGFMFWAAGCPGTRSLCTIPSDGYTCEGGIGQASIEMGLPLNTTKLRQK